MYVNAFTIIPKLLVYSMSLIGAQESLFFLNLTSVSFDGSLPFTCGELNSPAPAIVDTGTTNLFLPTAVYEAIETRIKELLGIKDKGFEQRLFDREVCAVIQDQQLEAMPTIRLGIPEAGTGLEFDVEVQPWQYFRLVGQSTLHSVLICTSCKLRTAPVACGPCKAIAILT